MGKGRSIRLAKHVVIDIDAFKEEQHSCSLVISL